jgi:hypothetical protein
MKTLFHCRDGAFKGAALMIVLAFVVLLTGVVLAYFSRTTTDRQLAQSSHNDTSADLLARSALDIVVSDFKQDILAHPTVTPGSPYYITPAPYPIPTPSDIPNLIRYSSRNAAASRASNVSSAAVSANSRYISTTVWNSHYLVPPGSSSGSSPVPSFTSPDWVLVTAQGPNLAPAPSAVIGRYAFAVYDEGGLLDMNLAGYPSWPSPTPACTPTPAPPAPSPTPWLVNVGRKGTLGFADLTALPTPGGGFMTQSQVNSIVGWRNYATTQRPTSQGFPSFFYGASGPGNTCATQDNYGSYLLDFGDPPYPSPCPIYPFTSVATDNYNARTDQALMTRQELLRLQPSGSFPLFNVNVLRYMGTFSRERNKPAPDWPQLNGHLPDRFDITNLGLVKPHPPPGTTTPRGRGQGHDVGGTFRGRGRFTGGAADIRSIFGLKWFVPDLGVTDSHQLAYWGHWQYVCNDTPCDHIPALRVGSNDFFQVLDYALTQANAQGDDTANVADILSLGASLIDQYDNSTAIDSTGDLDQDASIPAARKSRVTIIEYSGGRFVLGWETVVPVSDTTNPYNPSTGIFDPNTGTTKQTPNFTPITLDHAFTTVGDFGYGLRPEATPPAIRFQGLDFHTANSNANLLDFFTYNPVDHKYPRVGVVNLNTRNVPVIAAILQNALKTDVDAAPTPNPLPTVTPAEATLAAQAIVNATSTQPALTRADIGRLTAAAANSIGNPTNCTGECAEKVPEAIARALSEMTQTRTWNLFIDVIAQTGKYAPGATDVTDGSKFTVEGEKRYWLHIALGRDLVHTDGTPCLPGDTGCQVDVLGTQLEEVIE